jgi:uncharacterized protein YuzE
MDSRMVGSCCLPAELDAMTITVGDTTFDRVDYDAAADVLYLHIGDPATAVSFDESPEGHALRFDEGGRLIGITIVGARRTLESQHRLVVTVPSRIELDISQLGAVINAA